ncbi:MAG: type II toxin-antitoxin system RelE/ParE family toxin [Bacteroidales bacterium]|nr:type II toxin-antitoxin system RelE/ParE family toxin [Bacteroidales bacterium]HCI54945.1 type II toxin-antitoxin system RelE/ParE family toxin [Bacteroidales bacterium]
MKIIWTDFAVNSLLEIFQFYKESANINVALRIRSRIFHATRQLVKHSLSGQLEPNLIKLGEEHRYLVEGNYKIIYKRVKEGVLITDVFDTRQDPRKIQRRSSKPSR